MARLFVLVIASWPTVALAQGRPAEPLLYEIIINGEAFTVDASRSNKLESQKMPGVTYDVALRVAPVQRLVLNTLQFDYDRGFAVTDDHGRDVRAATLQHELGFSIILTDLGSKLDDARRRQVLDAVVQSMEKNFQRESPAELSVSRPEPQKLPNVSGEAVQIRMRDKQGNQRLCHVLLLQGDGFSCSAVIQMLAEDAADSLPLVDRTLHTIKPRALPRP
jgi:hypothetical protein